MKVYKKGSAGYDRQKKTQMFQAIAAMKPKPARRTDGQKFLHPERHPSKRHRILIQG